MELSTTEAADRLGVTYTRLYRLVQRGLVPHQAQGSGSRVRWSSDTVRRLRVALALAESIGSDERDATWNRCVDAVMRGPIPPDTDDGWVVLRDGRVMYAPDECALGAAVICGGGVVAPLRR